jgi:hypothetical protein
MPGQSRKEYYRRRRQRLALDPAWREKEKVRKAAWYARQPREEKILVSAEEKKRRRKSYDQARRARLSLIPGYEEKEKLRKAAWYARSK